MGDPAYRLAGKNPTTEQVEFIRSELGLDQSLLSQYTTFLKQTLSFQWGHSWHTQEKVTTMILAGIGPSLSLTVPAFIFSFLICLLIALYTTHFQGTLTDQALTTLCLALLSISYLVYIVVYQYLFAFKLNLFPINGWDPSWIFRWQYLLLPWLIIISASLGPNILIYRSIFIDEATQDYVITAKAKGLNNKRLYLKHVLKNAIIPILTIVTLQLPFLMTGSLLLETFFGIPGLGSVLIQAIQNADFPVIRAFTIIGSLSYMFFNLLADLSYAFFDPRVSLK